jgi:regulatory protein
MTSEEYKKAFLYLSNKCSKKEITSKEALVLASKFKLKIVDKKQLINDLKKKQFINHIRFAKAFTHDRFNFYNWGKLKIKYYLKQKGIEEAFISEALSTIDIKLYKDLVKQETEKKIVAMGSPTDYNSKQKLLKYLSQKGFETDLIFDVVEDLYS